MVEELILIRGGVNMQEECYRGGYCIYL